MPDLLTTGDFGMTATNDRVQAVMSQHNKRGRRALTPYEAKTLAEGELSPIYIYNVSPIHKHYRPQGQLGTIVIPARKWDEKYSIPVPIKGSVVRWYKTGLGAEQPFIEGGREIAEDVCGIGIVADGRNPNANLSNYGVFLSDKPFDPEFLPEPKRLKLAAATGKVAEQLYQEFIVSKHEQKQVLAEATEKLIGDLQSRILEADNWHMGGVESRKYIQHSPWHRDCLKAFNAITGKKETRPWASISTDEVLEACDFCGTRIKPGLIKCPNCLEVLDVAAYEAKKKKVGA